VLPENAWKDFPQLAQKIQGRSYSYLDSAATTLKPWPVLEAVSKFLTSDVANVHRGAYRLSDNVTESFESVRTQVSQWIGSQDPRQIIFTKGATESINLVSNSFRNLEYKKGDAIVVTQLEHHSNFVPWQQLCQEKGIDFLVVPVNDQGVLDLDKYEEFLKNYRVKLVSVTLMSNVLGVITDIQTIIQLAHKHGALVLGDAAQLISFQAIDVKKWDIDFLVFSGHKLFAPYGLGVLYGKFDVLNQISCYQFGGSMVLKVTQSQTQFQELPYRLEAGTPNIEGVIGLGAAISYLNKFDRSQMIEHEMGLHNLLIQELNLISEIKIFAHHLWQANDNQKGPVVSFILKGVHSSDVAQILNQENVFVRSGVHCAQPLAERLDLIKCGGSIRASLSVYSQKKDIEKLISAIYKAKEILL